MKKEKLLIKIANNLVNSEQYIRNQQQLITWTKYEGLNKYAYKT